MLIDISHANDYRVHKGWNWEAYDQDNLDTFYRSSGYHLQPN